MTGGPGKGQWRPPLMSPGDRFERLTVVAEMPERTKSGARKFLCVCDCGTERVVVSSKLRNGHTRSCGCLHRETTAAVGRRYADENRKPRVTHGQTGSPTFGSWLSMRRRCTDPNTIGWHNYGGRGIRVCERWAESFEMFLGDMGERPRGKTIDRIDPNGNYEPKNCRWATPLEQRHNWRTP